MTRIAKSQSPPSHPSTSGWYAFLVAVALFVAWLSWHGIADDAAPVAATPEIVTRLPDKVPAPSRVVSNPRPAAAPAPPPTPIQAFDAAYCKSVFANAKDAGQIQKVVQRLRHEEAQARQQLAALLLSAAESNNPLERAAALYFRAASADEMNFQSTDALAKMAVYSSDAQVYALAYRNCKLRGHSSEGFCAELNAAQWAQRDPGNGTAWLFAASDAVDRNNTGERDDALFRLTQAKHFDPGFSALVSLQDGLSGQGANATLDVALTKLSYALLAQSPNYRWVAQYCPSGELSNPNREQVCSSIASKLAQDESSLVNPSIASDLGEQLHWEPGKLEPLQMKVAALKLAKQDQFDATISNVVSELKKKGAQEFWCNYSAEMFQYQSRHLRLGEVRALSSNSEK